MGGDKNMYWFTGLLGLASITAPFVLNYSTESLALLVSLGVGIALVVTSAFEWLAEDKDKWEYYLAGVVGLGALIAPFILRFTEYSSAMWTMTIVGFLTVIIAGSKLFMDEKEYKY